MLAFFFRSWAQGTYRWPPCRYSPRSGLLVSSGGSAFIGLSVQPKQLWWLRFSGYFSVLLWPQWHARVKLCHFISESLCWRQVVELGDVFLRNACFSNLHRNPAFLRWFIDLIFTFFGQSSFPAAYRIFFYLALQIRRPCPLNKVVSCLISSWVHDREERLGLIWSLSEGGRHQLP